MATVKLNRRAALLAAAATLAGGRAVAQSDTGGWPNRSVRVIVPYPAGGTADVAARLFFAAVSARLGQPFVIENRSGATGTIGAAAAVQAAPDGYTVLYDATGLSVTPALFQRLPYDPMRDLVPVFRALTVPQLVLVHPSSPAKDIAGLIRLAKETAQGLDTGSAGNGSMQHLVLERFARAAGVKLNHVPYRGGAPALNDLIARQIQLYFGNVNVSTTFVRDGALRALAHTGRGRLAALPELPPLSETLPGFETYEWNGVFLPKGTPQPIVDALSAALNAVVTDPVLAEKLRAADLEAGPNSPAEFTRFFRDQSTFWQGFVREAGIRLE
ncbi:tripartite tricarboxylate transporter substrate-binding protein [Pseudoroseomonas cervicalis]|uniref:tripartite tricarboxylate transporter substrate-binding protein n=1 Tax=Teichococcus cervicalis TaxID=204525 RepID=UPI002787A4FC|nr:tripartite tricarboxylate transporter substrate-binding protein [Pseudoroseomonas cervicalis]MDQ1079100.1 tripartite-type tricarboxylate transporter receptor subunit TctC [Pseudoroseomonas cervicalis]